MNSYSGKLNTDYGKSKKVFSLKPESMIPTMKSFAELDYLDLDPTVKGQVAAMVQLLLDETERDVMLLHLNETEIQEKNTVIQAKDSAIKAKDFKIEALTHELSHNRTDAIRISGRILTLSHLEI